MDFSANRSKEDLAADLRERLSTANESLIAPGKAPSVNVVKDSETGRFATGNRVSTGIYKQSGLVALIKAKTDNFATLVNLLVKVHKGEEVKGRKPTLKDQIDATKELLDRGAGKAVQMQVVTDDSTAKQLLATRQQQLELQRIEAEGKAITGNHAATLDGAALHNQVDSQDTGLSSIDSMRRAKGGTEIGTGTE